MVKRCAKCRGETRQNSVEEQIEYELIKASVEKVTVDGKPMLMTRYPVMGKPEVLYRPELSNSKAAQAKTRSLFIKLHRLKLWQQFDEEIRKSEQEQHIRFLSESEQEEFLRSYHCFSGLTYSVKTSSTTQKCRPCCDSSQYHPSGSLNSHLPLGINMLNDMRRIFHSFRLNVFALAADLHRCYRSMKSDEVGSRLRAIWYPKDASDPACNTFRIFL